jgi:DNA-binding Xre family transcriptional regulator
MLFLNLNRLFFMRGITNPHRFLVKNGFSANIAQRILHHQNTHIKMTHLLHLCEILRCTPNDLFDFKAEKNSYLDDNHPLRTVKKESIGLNIPAYFLSASFENLNELKTLIEQQKNKSA